MASHSMTRSFSVYFLGMEKKMIGLAQYDGLGIDIRKIKIKLVFIYNNRFLPILLSWVGFVAVWAFLCFALLYSTSEVHVLPSELILELLLQWI